MLCVALSRVAESVTGAVLLPCSLLTTPSFDGLHFLITYCVLLIVSNRKCRGESTQRHVVSLSPFTQRSKTKMTLFCITKSFLHVAAFCKMEVSSETAPSPWSWRR